MSQNGRLALPGQVPIGFQAHPAPTAHPSTMVLQQQGGGAQVFQFGGYSKLEDATLRMMEIADSDLTCAGDSMANVNQVADRAVLLAIAALKAANEYQPPKIESREAT